MRLNYLSGLATKLVGSGVIQPRTPHRFEPAFETATPAPVEDAPTFGVRDAPRAANAPTSDEPAARAAPTTAPPAIRHSPPPLDDGLDVAGSAVLATRDRPSPAPVGRPVVETANRPVLEPHDRFLDAPTRNEEEPRATARADGREPRSSERVQDVPQHSPLGPARSDTPMDERVTASPPVIEGRVAAAKPRATIMTDEPAARLAAESPITSPRARALAGPLETEAPASEPYRPTPAPMASPGRHGAPEASFVRAPSSRAAHGTDPDPTSDRSVTTRVEPAHRTDAAPKPPHDRSQVESPAPRERLHPHPAPAAPLSPPASSPLVAAPVVGAPATVRPHHAATAAPTPVTTTPRTTRAVLAEEHPHRLPAAAHRSIGRSDVGGAPPVHVTIGRIEIRTVPPPAVKATRPRPAPMGLDEYWLRKSTRGAR